MQLPRPPCPPSLRPHPGAGPDQSGWPELPRHPCPAPPLCRGEQAAMTFHHCAPPLVPTGPVSAQMSGPRTRHKEERREKRVQTPPPGGDPGGCARRPFLHRLQNSKNQNKESEERRAQGLEPAQTPAAPLARGTAVDISGGSRAPWPMERAGVSPGPWSRVASLVQGRFPAPAPHESSSREGRELHEARRFYKFQLQTVLGVLRGTRVHSLGARGERLGQAAWGRAPMLWARKGCSWPGGSG